ncbi:MAG: tRNA (adenosine(37)-N6)-dimethylallyltransferase MiaA [Patescibacteria group bacterium]
MRNKLIVILGPTASGKSDLAIKLAKRFKGEIVSADSRQIYQEMNIGTAKITKKQMADIPHYLIDIIKPDQGFTLAQFKAKAVKIIKDIQKRKKLPFLVGGTMLYIQAIVDNLQIPEVKPDKKLRAQLENKTNQQLYDQLKKIDPQALEKIALNNKRRLIRALEVYLKTQKLFSRLKKKGRPLFDILQLGLRPDQEILNRRIDQRAEKMIEAGLIKEVECLIRKYGTKPYSLSGIGYREIIRYLNKEITLKQAKDLIKIHTRQYTRRQMSWFKRDKRIHWIKNYPQAEKLIRDFIKNNGLFL